MNLRNIAIIAHVDHGKTTLVDGLLKQSKTFQEHESYMTQDLIMDTNEQERERGITILAKNTSVKYKGVKINIIDTPGHADFAGEVERTLNMADGALLLVDAQEGPMPQTKFVLKKALGLGLKTIVVVNKIDKRDADIDHTVGRVYDLFLDLATDESQLEFPIIYAIGREAKAWTKIPDDPSLPADLSPVFDAILSFIPEPNLDPTGPFQIQVTTLAWDTHKGKYALGRINRGKVVAGQKVLLLKHDGSQEDCVVDKVYMTEGLKRVDIEEGKAGDIVAISGIKNADIGDTLADPSSPERLPDLDLEEPTLSVSIGANTSPFKGREGDFVNSRQILARIEKEIQTNIAMKFNIDSSGQYVVSGRGELHISVFLETLRREGYELEVGQPRVITKVVDGVVMEPIEEVTIDVANDYDGAVKSELGRRRGIQVFQEDLGSNTARMIFELPTKSIIGLVGVLSTQTKGTAVVNTIFLRYQKMSAGMDKLRKGVLISSDTGSTTVYGLRVAQDNGITFVGPGTDVYTGMIVGLNSRDKDLEINVCKGKALSNVRSLGEEAITIAPPQNMSLEQSLSFLEEDELLEITPKSLRLRKKILDTTQRVRAARRK
ncbi:translational GTPase TypA [Candidatus Nomurabacteria bacterium]|uniref:50S ribosomal subunit assembly factor BipA n=1 Tax=candidate division WWE3 bacterium TaxID=2053526 RepID=A0A955E2C0_UNCKA|nr:translational GTPase TypA [candidate division WWE3 bacterium]MCB9823409.1 translational GTPase TypA [Candidatus Nomurabacteria bacterium]MCB9827691.1 translational GTPase TypA [Candidatus Nomurabacteria bacterium]